MAQFTYQFLFSEVSDRPVKGCLELEQPLLYREMSGGSGFYRLGKLSLEEGAGLDLVLYNNQATAKFIYLRTAPVDLNLAHLIGLQPEDVSHLSNIVLPGQLCMGSVRANLIGQAIRNLVSAPALKPVLASHHQQNLAVFPIAREGLKYQVAEAIFDNYGYFGKIFITTDTCWQ